MTTLLELTKKLHNTLALYNGAGHALGWKTEKVDKLLDESKRVIELAEQPAQQEPTKAAELVDALIAKYSDKLFDSVGPHDAAKFEEDCNHIKQALAEQQQGVKFNEGMWQEREARIAQLGAELMRMKGRELKLQFALTEQPAQQEPVAFSQFLSDVVTAAGLLAHGKTDKSLAARISEFAFRLRTSPPAQRKPLTGEEMNQIEARWEASMHGSKIAFVVRETEAAHGIKENT